MMVETIIVVALITVIIAVMGEINTIEINTIEINTMVIALLTITSLPGEWVWRSRQGQTRRLNAAERGRLEGVTTTSASPDATVVDVPRAMDLLALDATVVDVPRANAVAVLGEVRSEPERAEDG